MARDGGAEPATGRYLRNRHHEDWRMAHSQRVRAPRHRQSGGIVEAKQKLELNQRESLSHEIGHAVLADDVDATPKSIN